MEWYYILGAISYGIFIIQFILSCVGNEMDFLDLDITGDGDIDVFGSDILSFKGLIHFCMGLSGWLMVSKSDAIGNIIIAVCFGIIFMVGLYLIYKMLLKLSNENVPKEGESLIGQHVRITHHAVYEVLRKTYDSHGSQDLKFSKEENYFEYYAFVNGIEIRCLSKSPSLSIGSKHIIKSYDDGVYYI